jgi:hypothetical protein
LPTTAICPSPTSQDTTDQLTITSHLKHHIKNNPPQARGFSSWAVLAEKNVTIGV